jgi:hypothetical protein
MSKMIDINMDMDKIKDTQPTLEKSPRKPSRSMKKIKSEEDFVKFQVPWIL